MTVLERLITRTGEPDDKLLKDCLESAKAAILTRRFPYQDWPTRQVVKDDGSVAEETYVEPRYEDLWYRCALDLYSKVGAEGQTSHGENGIQRTYESSWISKSLLNEITPYVGVIG